MTKLGRKNKSYSNEQKLYHVKQILSRRITVTSYAHETGIVSKNLYRWLDKYSTKSHMKKSKSQKSEMQDKLELLRAENERLQVLLTDERMKRQAYKLMIDIAEKKFNIPIQKKSGAKQSKK